MIGWVIALIIVVVIVLMIIGFYNSLIRLRNQVKNAFAQIDVQLKRRNDLIPNLVETVKGYMKHEKGVLENITKARSALMNASDFAGKAKASGELTNTLKTLFAVAENYPTLKANENFMQLQEELTTTENKISYARQFYNDMVLKYDTTRQTIPNNIVAAIFRFEDKDYFKVAEAEKEVPKVKFG